jgi:hypothetical protein
MFLVLSLTPLRSVQPVRTLSLDDGSRPLARLGSF